MQRYSIVAKRRNTDEPFTEWTTAKNYYRALHHAAKVEEAGFDGRIVVHDEVLDIWDILETVGCPDAKETTDKIFDADFRKASAIKEQTARALFIEFAKALKENTETVKDQGKEIKTLDFESFDKALAELRKKYGVVWHKEQKTEDATRCDE